MNKYKTKNKKVEIHPLGCSFGIMINTNKNNDPTGGSNIITENPWTGEKAGN